MNLPVKNKKLWTKNVESWDKGFSYKGDEESIFPFNNELTFHEKVIKTMRNGVENYLVEGIQITWSGDPFDMVIENGRTSVEYYIKYK